MLRCMATTMRATKAMVADDLLSVTTTPNTIIGIFKGRLDEGDHCGWMSRSGVQYLCSCPRFYRDIDSDVDPILCEHLTYIAMIYLQLSVRVIDPWFKTQVK